ncbi:MAG: aminomethyltransferase family protein [Phycisphaeraceae bacterium]|nr:aminomethyltransferase family protein [Phycisphaeraceae bacterium]
MARVSPLAIEHDSAGAVLAPYGPEGHGIAVVQVYSGVGREYAAIRKSAAVLDLPHRAVLRVSGADRLAFLNRMLTQELKGVADGSVRRSFWLNRKGRIDADLVVILRAGEILLELDAHAVERTIQGLGGYIIADDVTIDDRSEHVHRLSLHGVGAADILAVATPVGAAPPITALRPDHAGDYRIADAAVTIWRQDSTGDPGYELLLDTPHAAAVYSALAEPLSGPIDRPDRAFDLVERAHAGPPRAIRAGWHAYNVARIEAGTPLYYLDFGPDSLPHEAGDGALADRVSFKKGCYLGQEIVARMQSLGHPKQKVVAFEFPDLPDPTPDAPPPQPVTGTPVTESNDPAAEPVGAVTSSTLSPMLGSRPVCFAMMKFKHTTPGASVHIHIPGHAPLRASVRESLRFWKRGE